MIVVRRDNAEFTVPKNQIIEDLQPTIQAKPGVHFESEMNFDKIKLRWPRPNKYAHLHFLSIEGAKIAAQEQPRSRRCLRRSYV